MNFALSKTKTILGIPLYRKYRAEKGLKRVFLGGIYREIVTFEDYGEASRQSSLLGIPVWGRRLNQQAISWHIGSSLIVKKISIAKELSFQLDSIFSKMPVRPVNGRKHIFIFWANSGEIALLLMFFWKQLLKRYEIRAPEEVVVLCTKQYHQDMLRLYFPEIRSVVAKPKILRYVLDDIEADGWQVYMCFPGKYFARFEASVNGVAINYLEWMSKWFQLKIGAPVKQNEKEFNKAFKSAIDKLSLEQKNALNDKAEKGLAILALDSFSSSNLDDKFKQIISSDVSSKYVILENTTKFSYPEIFAIATKAKELIALRSGIVDFLSNSGIKMHLFYTDFPDRGFNTPPKSAKEVLSLFSIKSIPLLNARTSKEIVVKNMKNEDETIFI